MFDNYAISILNFIKTDIHKIPAEGNYGKSYPSKMELFQRTVNKPCAVIYCDCLFPSFNEYTTLLDYQGRHTCHGIDKKGDERRFAVDLKVIWLTIGQFLSVVVHILYDKALTNQCTNHTEISRRTSKPYIPSSIYLFAHFFIQPKVTNPTYLQKNHEKYSPIIRFSNVNTNRFNTISPINVQHVLFLYVAHLSYKTLEFMLKSLQPVPLCANFTLGMVHLVFALLCDDTERVESKSGYKSKLQLELEYLWSEFVAQVGFAKDMFQEVLDFVSRLCKHLIDPTIYEVHPLSIGLLATDVVTEGNMREELQILMQVANNNDHTMEKALKSDQQMFVQNMFVPFICQLIDDLLLKQDLLFNMADLHGYNLSRNVYNKGYMNKKKDKISRYIKASPYTIENQEIPILVHYIIEGLDADFLRKFFFYMLNIFHQFFVQEQKEIDFRDSSRNTTENPFMIDVSSMFAVNLLTPSGKSLQRVAVSIDQDAYELIHWSQYFHAHRIYHKNKNTNSLISSYPNIAFNKNCAPALFCACLEVDNETSQNIGFNVHSVYKLMVFFQILFGEGLHSYQNITFVDAQRFVCFVTVMKKLFITPNNNSSMQPRKSLPIPRSTFLAMLFPVSSLCIYDNTPGATSYIRVCNAVMTLRRGFELLGKPFLKLGENKEYEYYYTKAVQENTLESKEMAVSQLIFSDDPETQKNGDRVVFNSNQREQIFNMLEELMKENTEGAFLAVDILCTLSVSLGVCTRDYFETTTTFTNEMFDEDNSTYWRKGLDKQQRKPNPYDKTPEYLYLSSWIILYALNVGDNNESILSTNSDGINATHGLSRHQIKPFAESVARRERKAVIGYDHSTNSELFINSLGVFPLYVDNGNPMTNIMKNIQSSFTCNNPTFINEMSNKMSLILHEEKMKHSHQKVQIQTNNSSSSLSILTNEELELERYTSQNNYGFNDGEFSRSNSPHHHNSNSNSNSSNYFTNTNNIAYNPVLPPENQVSNGSESPKFQDSDDDLDPSDFAPNGRRSPGMEPTTPPPTNNPNDSRHWPSYHITPSTYSQSSPKQSIINIENLRAAVRSIAHVPDTVRNLENTIIAADEELGSTILIEAERGERQLKFPDSSQHSNSIDALKNDINQMDQELFLTTLPHNSNDANKRKSDDVVDLNSQSTKPKQPIKKKSKLMINLLNLNRKKD